MPRSRAKALDRLREILGQAGYTEKGLRSLVRDEGTLGVAEGLAALPLRPEAEEPLAVQARLFLGGESIRTRLAETALAPLKAADLPDLLTVRNGGVRSRVVLEPFDGLLVAADRSGSMGVNHVVGIGGGTRILAALTVRRRVEAVLDMCTGSGSLALLAARHAERVVGIDLNRRALRLAQLNAELNGFTGVEWRHGDLYEPVAGEEFDLVLANPPFVVSPKGSFLFRDGDRDDDALSRAVVEGAAARLREGGYAQILCNWVAPAKGRWSKTPRSWIRGSGCDAWLLHYRTDNPASYAVHWNLWPGRKLTAAAAEAATWVDYYGKRGIEAIATGVIVLRRRSGRNWVREDELVRTPVGAAGAHVERVFAAQDLLKTMKDERELLALPLAVAPKVMLVERRHPGGALERARLTIEEGIPLSGRIPEACLPVVAALNGERPLRKAIKIAARDRGVTPETLAAECLPDLGDLLARGLLVAQGVSTQTK